MRKLKLVNNREKVYLDHEDNYYIIRTIQEWNMVVNFTDAYIIFEIPGFSILERNLKSEVNRKFIDFQNYKLIEDLDFTDLSFNSWKFFNGIMEGNNKSIKTTDIIFKEINRATIKNLVIDNKNLLAKTIHLCDLENIKLNNSLCETFSGKIRKLIIDNDLDNPVCNIFSGEMIESNINNKSKEIKLFNINKGKIEDCEFNNLLIENDIYNSKVYKDLELYMIFDKEGKAEKFEITKKEEIVEITKKEEIVEITKKEEIVEITKKEEKTDDLFISVYENTGIDTSRDQSETNNIKSGESTETKINKVATNLLRLRRR